MLLSQAIRLGAKLGPSAVGSYFNYGEKDRIVGCCALGGALLIHHGYTKFPQASEITRMPVHELVYYVFDARHDLEAEDYPATLTSEDVFETSENMLGSIIARLNDNEEDWTREMIADWVEKMENEGRIWYETK